MKAILFTVTLTAGAVLAASGSYFSTQYESEQAVSDERRTPLPGFAGAHEFP
jgi:hypothetical protein